MITIIISCSGSENIAKKIAKRMSLPFSILNTVKFPDGEFDISFNKSIKNKKIYLVQNFQNTKEITLNDKIIETLFAVHTAKDLKAKKVFLIAPYFPYFRGDKRFKKEECISIQVMNKLFSVFDKIFCVAPHLHRIKNVKKALSNGEIITIDKPIIEYLKKQTLKEPIFVGPDIESQQWVVNVSKAFNKKPVIALKTRKNARKVEISLPKNIDAKGKDLIIIDDIISTGHTMIENIKQLKKYKPNNIYVIGIHGVFAENALKKLKKHCVVASTNTLENKVDVIDVSKQIVDVVKKKI